MGWQKIGRQDGNFVRFKEPGQELTGRWRGTRNGRYGTLGVIETPEGDRLFYLTKALEPLEDVDGGTLVKVRFEGEDQTKSGARFKRFDIFTDPEAPFEATPADVPF